MALSRHGTNGRVHFRGISAEELHFREILGVDSTRLTTGGRGFALRIIPALLLVMPAVWAGLRLG